MIDTQSGTSLGQHPRRAWIPWLAAFGLQVTMFIAALLVVASSPRGTVAAIQTLGWTAVKLVVVDVFAALLVLRWRVQTVTLLHRGYRWLVNRRGADWLPVGLALALVVSARYGDGLILADRRPGLLMDIWQSAAILALIAVTAVAAERLRMRQAAGLPPPGVWRTTAAAAGLMVLAFLLAPALSLSVSLPLLAIASMAIPQPSSRRLIHAGIGIVGLGAFTVLVRPFVLARQLDAWFGAPDVTGWHYQWAQVYRILQQTPAFGPDEVALGIPRGEDQLLLASLTGHIGLVPSLLLAAAVVALALWTWSGCRNAAVGGSGRNVLRSMGLAASGMLLVSVLLSLPANYALSRLPYGLGTAFFSPQLPMLMLSAVALLAASLAPRRQVPSRRPRSGPSTDLRIVQGAGVLLFAACVWQVFLILDNPLRSPRTPPERAKILDREGRLLAYTDPVETRPGERKAVRRYPEGVATAHLLGFVLGDGSAGQEGLELAMNERLAASDNGIFAPSRTEPLVTTIDRDVQRAAHAALTEAATQEEATAGAVVVLDKWGRIRALASYPTYNPDDPEFRWELDPSYRVLFNHYAAESFSPGELLTPLLAASWLQFKGMARQMNIDVTPFDVQGKAIRDVRDSQTLSVSEAIARSSRVAHAKVALSMAPKHWTSYLRSLKLGDYPRTRGIPGETPGRVPAYCQLGPKRQATLGFPQVGKDGKLEVDATAEASLLQVAAAYLPIANGSGMPPRLSLLSEDPPAVDVVLTREAIAQTRAMLEEAVSPRGTGFRARVPGIRVGGKTASIRMPPVHEDPARSIGAFVGLAPIDDPQYIVAVMLEVEGPGNRLLLGGDVAAPVFAQIVRDTMTVARRHGEQYQ